MTVLVVGVFSTSNRRLTTTGTIRFTPDTRAAVELTFSITNAWQKQGTTTVKVDQVETIRNYTGGESSNPVVGDFYHVSGNNIISDGAIVYQNLVFDPAGVVTPNSDILLNFEIANNSARSDKPLRVTFQTATDNAMKAYNDASSPKMGYEIANSVITINQGASSNLSITLKLRDASQTLTPILFSFGLTFDFES